MATSSFADLPTASAPRVRRPLILAVAGAGVLVVLAAVLLLRAGGDDHAPARFTAPGKAFSVVLPDGWRALDARELRAVPGVPAAVLRRADGSGVVVIRRRAARTVKLTGGAAYVYTFARPTAGRVQSLAVAPRAGRTYTLDAVAGAGARDVAAQIGAIVRSFDTTDHAPRS
jgi:hypothetical protein